MNAPETFIRQGKISSEICQSLIKLFNNTPRKFWSEVKDCEGQWEETDFLPTDPVMSEYISHLQTVMDSYIAEFPYVNMYSPFTIVEPIKIQHYTPAAGYNVWHTERGSKHFENRNRHLVFMTYLNTVTDQGGTEFMHQKCITRAEEGVTLIWPADWTHTHRGVISPTQEKYIITGWYNFI